MTANSIITEPGDNRREQTVHNALTLCERNKHVDIEFQPSLPASRACLRREIEVGDVVTLRRDEETLTVKVGAEADAGLFVGEIIDFGSRRGMYRDMWIGDAVIFQACHVFACAVHAPVICR